MTLTTELPAELSVRRVVMTYGPPHVPTLGYVMYKRSVEAEAAAQVRTEGLPAKDGESKPADRSLVDTADRILDQFRKVFGLVSVGSPEWIYLGKIELAAYNYCMGLVALKRDQRSQVERSEERRYLETSRSVITATAWGMLRATGTVLAFGGVAAALGQLAALFVHDSNATTRLWISVVCGAIAFLWSGAYLIGKTGRALNLIDGDFQKTLDQIEEKQKEGHRKHYEVAMAFANQAWTELTGEPPPLNDPLEFVLRRLMNGEERKKPSAPLGRFNALLKMAKMVRRTAQIRRKIERRVDAFRAPRNMATG